MRSVESGKAGDGSGLFALALSPDVRLALIVGGFFLLALIRIGFPDHYNFDEQYYVPAAARLALGIDVINREHPMLAKEILALFLWALGSAPVVWRIGPLIFGCVSLWTFAAALGVHTRCRWTETVFALLLASSFLLFTLSRIAMLDAFMFGFAGTATLLFVQGRLTFAGVASGLAVACKWSAAPLLALFALAAVRRTPVRAFAMGLVAVAVYFATFLPGALMADPLVPKDWAALHWAILNLHADYVRIHAYSSQWWHWIVNVAPVWLIAGEFEGGYRAVLLGLNPASGAMIPAALSWAAFMRVRVALAPLAAFAALMLFWAVSGKNQQFVYHYLLPMTFGLAVVAVALVRLWSAGWRKTALAALAAPLLFFAWYYPALTGAPGIRIDRYDWMPGWDVRPHNPAGTPERVREGEKREGCLYFPHDCWPAGGEGADAARRKFLELRARQEAAKRATAAR